MDSFEPHAIPDPLHEIERWLRESVDHHRSAAPAEGTGRSSLDHAWYQAQMRALADRVSALRMAHAGVAQRSADKLDS